MSKSKSKLYATHSSDLAGYLDLGKSLGLTKQNGR
jgi:hypothetical protein